ncbi:MAG: alcohol dehydrogenase catalytic domain-containing protein [Candidatus Altiarchaeota archaeon]
MKVAMYYSNADVRVEELPKPEIDAGEILMKCMASGICGSDLMEWYRIKKAPLVLGHEVAGVIEEVGEGVTKFKVGDRIMATHHVCCASCRFCLSDRETSCEMIGKTKFFPGGFSQYIRIPKINIEKGGVLALSDNVSFEVGSFVEPLGCVLRSQKKAGVKEGQSVLVLGSGISGLLHIKLAKALGVKKVFASDVQEYKLEKAEKSGADYAIDARMDIREFVKEKNDGGLVDTVILTTGAVSAVKQAFGCVEKGGTVLFFAPADPGVDYPLPLNDLWFRQLSLTQTYAADSSDLRQALELISKGLVEVEDLVTHRLSLNETGLGFKLVSEGKESIKVIIEPNR